MGTYMTIPQNDSELYHHGVLGMKWGIRRYQSYDEKPRKSGEGGKEIGEAKIKSPSISENHNADNSINETLPQSNKNHTNANHETENKKEVLDSYKRAGMSQSEAEAAYEKRQKIKKIVAISMGVTLAAATAYVLYRSKNREHFDKIIPEGAKLQTMSVIEDKMTLRPGNGTWDSGNSDFYAAYKDVDKVRYRALFGNGKSKFEADVLQNMKIASHDSAKKEFKKLLDTDSNFESGVREAIDNINTEAAIKLNHPIKSRSYEKVFNKFVDGQSLTEKEKSDLYDIYSSGGILNNSKNSQETKKKLYKELKSKGYQGLLDFNDTSSGLKTNHPVVIFDTSKIGTPTESQYNLNLKDTAFATAINTAQGNSLLALSSVIWVPAAVTSAYDNKVTNDAESKTKKRKGIEDGR